MVTGFSNLHNYFKKICYVNIISGKEFSHFIKKAKNLFCAENQRIRFHEGILPVQIT